MALSLSSPTAGRSFRRTLGAGRVRSGPIVAVLLGLLVCAVPSAGLGSLGHPSPALPGREPSSPATPVVDPLASARASLAAGHGPAMASSGESGGAGGASPPLTTVSMAYDARDHYVLVVAGNVSSASGGYAWGSQVDTWTFVAGNWTKLATNASPPNRVHESMAYDPTDEYVLLFGGVSFSSVPNGAIDYLSDTWAYHAGTWTNLTSNVTNAPSPRGYTEMVWDAADHYAVLFGGMGVNGNITGNLSQTWSYVGGAWTPHTNGSSPPNQGALAYDSHDGYVLYFGGAFTDGTLANATWTFLGGSWTDITATVHRAPSARDNPMATDDPNLGGVLLFGGNSGPGWSMVNDSWEYSNRTWTRLSTASGPSPRYLGQMVFDGADNVPILFGGENQSETFSDTWAFGTAGNASSGWAQAAPVLRISHSRIDLGMPVTFSATSVFGTGAVAINYTGLPNGCSPGNSGSLTCTPTLAGTYTVRMTAVVSGARSTAYASLQVNPTVQILSLSVTPTVLDSGHAIQIAASAGGGTPALEFAYSNLPAGCGSENLTAWSCTPASPGNYTLQLTVSDAVGMVVRQSVTLGVAAAPAVRSFSLSPSTVDLSQSSTIALGVAGGVGPYTYAYPTLPAGCSTQNTTLLVCTPDATGTFSVAAEVVDTFGVGATAAGSLTVNPWPSVASFTTSATNPTVGDTLTLNAVATGGTGTLAFTYQGLPTGCEGANVATLTCSPASPGTYSVTVRVADTVGGTTTSAALVLHVAVAPTSPGSPTHTVGSHPTPSGSSALFTPNFALGVLAGLVALGVVGGVLAWRARVERDGARMLRDLRRRTSHRPNDEGTGAEKP